ncbi:MAG: hypothetical protein Q8Q85_07620 [Gemmatimonadales bacterium]|nr:hypothetical protein [Gemmatimonadales bacterium]
MGIAERVLVLVVDGPVRLAARILAERYPEVLSDGGSLSVVIDGRETPEGVFAFCRERRISVKASCVLSRVAAHRTAAGALPTSSPFGATNHPSSQEAWQ